MLGGILGGNQTAGGQGGIISNFTQRGVLARAVKFLVTKKETGSAVQAKVKVFGPVGRVVVLAEGDAWTPLGDGKAVPTVFRVPMGVSRWYEITVNGYKSTIRNRFSVMSDVDIKIEVD